MQTPTRKRPAYARGSPYSKRKKYAMQVYRRRTMALARGAIGARVHIFKRVAEAFGFVSGVTGVSTFETINTGSGTNEFLLNLANTSASQFQNGAYQFGGALQFMLKHVANYSEIVNLFDNYRIKMVYVKVLPGFNSADVSGGYINIPMMHYTVDADDGATPNNRSEILQNSKCRSVRLDGPFTIAFKPRAQTIVQSQANGAAGTVAGGLLPASTWLDTANQVVPHFGLKFWIDEFPTVPLATSARAIVKFSVTYILETKNVV